MNTTASQIVPTCFVYNNRGHGATRYVGCTVVSETKTTITVKAVDSDTTLTFQKHKDYLSGVYEDPRVSTLKPSGYGLGFIQERGGDRFYPNHLTFDLAGVQERRLNQKIERRKSALRAAKDALAAVEHDLTTLATYQAGDEVFEQLQKLKAAIESDLA